MKKLLPLLLLILIGCSEPEREPINVKFLNNVDGIYYTSENKPYSGKIFRTYSNNSNEIWTEGVLENGIPTTYIVPTDSEKLNLRNGSIYKINSDIPFTGPVYTLYPNGNIMEEGSFLNGLIDKKLIFYFSDGQVKTESIFINGEEKDTTIYFENGQIKSESISLGELSSFKKRYDSDGTLMSERNYLGLEQNGPFKTYHENGELNITGTYKLGKLDGERKSYWNNGVLKEKNYYVSGEVVGDSFEYNRSGQLLFVKPNGPNGPYSKYYDNGKTKEIGIRKGWKYIISESYYEDGQLKFKRNIDKNFTEEFYPNGDLKRKGDELNFIKYNKNQKVGNSEIEYRNELPFHGKEIIELGYSPREVFYISIYENGKIISKEFKKFENDVVIMNGFMLGDNRDGLWKIYDDDGVLSSTEYYKNGKLNGPYQVFDIEGKLIEEGVYRNNRIVSSKTY